MLCIEILHNKHDKGKKTDGHWNATLLSPSIFMCVTLTNLKEIYI